MRLRVWRGTEPAPRRTEAHPAIKQREAIHKMEQTDLDRLYALDQLCFHPGIAYTRSELAVFLAHPSAFGVLLEDAPTRPGEPGELLGFAIARTLRNHSRALFHIITIDVAPTARRRGIGTRLMDWITSKARELRLEALRLEVAVDNGVALGFYQQQGFVQVSSIPGYYLGRIDALVLERALEQPSGLGALVRLARR